MKFQLLLVLSLAYAASAYQYNYYSRPLSYSGAMEMDTLVEATTMMPLPVTESPLSIRPMSVAPVTERVLTREENPCTEEVLRSPEIQAFRDPLDRTKYIVCTEVDVFVRMPCAVGTVFDETIRHCVPDGWVPPVCPVGLCKNQADCIIDELKNEYKCLCRVGFTGLFCETNIDECALEGNEVCRKSGGTCVDQLNAYYCDFGTTIGLNRENAIPTPCTLEDLSLERQFFELPSPLGNAFLQCTGENRFVVSKCADMLFWNQELRTCTIEKPLIKTGVCETLPCKNDGICEDLGNFQFRCACAPGFTGELCEDLIDFCLESPCGTGRCVTHPGGYNCVCENNIVDKSCELIVENPCLDSPLDYLPYPRNVSRYIVCGLDRLAFVKNCAEGLFWNDQVKTCVAPEPVMPTVTVPKRPMMSLFDGVRLPMMPTPVKQPSYGSYGAVEETVEPIVKTMPTKPSYGSYGTVEPMMPTTTVAPVVPVRQVRPVMPTVTQAPVVQLPVRPAMPTMTRPAY